MATNTGAETKVADADFGDAGSTIVGAQTSAVGGIAETDKIYALDSLRIGSTATENQRVEEHANHRRSNNQAVLAKFRRYCDHVDFDIVGV